jgi:hypothetical protein
MGSSSVSEAFCLEVDGLPAEQHVSNSRDSDRSLEQSHRHVEASREIGGIHQALDNSNASSNWQPESSGSAVKGQHAMENIGGCDEQKLIYLSCGFKALTHDVEVLVSDGGWKLSSVQTFTFFPGTDSIETLVVMKRARH